MASWARTGPWLRGGELCWTDNPGRRQGRHEMLRGTFQSSCLFRPAFSGIDGGTALAPHHCEVIKLVI